VLKTSHLLHLCRYIHGNPVKDELVAGPANPKRFKKRHRLAVGIGPADRPKEIIQQPLLHAHSASMAFRSGK
jgi:hypothetical protein